MPRFVVHRHSATRLHFDLRLEYGGVLKSWAVPKGLPEKSGIKRLAVETEDHALSYIGFEGVIPEGQYGAGTVEVWDSGRYEAESWAKDKIVVEFKGGKLTGRYALVRFGDKNWLMLKLKEK